jgi:hypothetical protein
MRYDRTVKLAGVLANNRTPFFSCAAGVIPTCLSYRFSPLLWILAVDSHIFGRVIQFMYASRGMTRLNRE